MTEEKYAEEGQPEETSEALEAQQALEEALTDVNYESMSY